MMLGPINPVILGILLISIIAAVTDFWKGRIYNWLTFGGIIIGLVLSFGLKGWPGLQASLFGIGVGFLLYAWMFFLGFLGGGDVKLLMALGAWGGPSFALSTGLLAILIGGAMALLLLVFKGQFRSFWNRVGFFFVSLMSKELKVQAPLIDKKLKMPFGIPIALAAIWALFGDPIHWIRVGL